MNAIQKFVCQCVQRCFGWFGKESQGKTLIASHFCGGAKLRGRRWLLCVSVGPRLFHAFAGIELENTPYTTFTIERYLCVSNFELTIQARFT